LCCFPGFKLCTFPRWILITAKPQEEGPEILEHSQAAAAPEGQPRGWCIAVVGNLWEFCENLGKPRENQNIPWLFHGLESNFLTKMANGE
jgi:hypothetical protein